MNVSDEVRSSRRRLIPGLSLRVGDALGSYRVSSLLRADRACAWLLASPMSGGPDVEIQVLLAMEDDLDAVRDRFLAEARRVAALSGRGLVRVLDTGLTKDGHPFCVREAKTGETLAALLDREGALSTDEAVDIALALCESLGEAHAQGVVHGELVAGLVHLSWSEERGPSDVKIDDLGTSRALALLPFTARALQRLSITAPEVWESGPGERSDVWSVGALLYRMLSDSTPFAISQDSTVSLSAALDEPALLAGVPDMLSDIVDACLARDPARRPSTMEALAERLAPFGFRPVSVPPPLPPPPLPVFVAKRPSPSIPPAVELQARAASRTSGFMVVAGGIAAGIAIGVLCTLLANGDEPPTTAATVRVAITDPDPAPAIAAEPTTRASDAPSASAAPRPRVVVAPPAPKPVSPLKVANDDDLRRFLDDRR